MPTTLAAAPPNPNLPNDPPTIPHVLLPYLKPSAPPHCLIAMPAVICHTYCCSKSQLAPTTHPSFPTSCCPAPSLLLLLIALSPRLARLPLLLQIPACLTTYPPFLTSRCLAPSLLLLLIAQLPHLLPPATPATPTTLAAAPPNPSLLNDPPTSPYISLPCPKPFAPPHHPITTPTTTPAALAAPTNAHAMGSAG